MDVLNATGRKRETYHIELKYSLMWECALGIAAVTNTPLLNTLEKPESYWEDVRAILSKEMTEHLDFVERHNTWKAILQLLHKNDISSLDEFIHFIEYLQEEDLRYQCLPYLGLEFQEARKRAASGDKAATHSLMDKTKDHNFFPKYIEFICSTEVNILKTHFISVMVGWYQSVIQPNAESMNLILQRDVDAKTKMSLKLRPEELVEWATGGIHYLPEPSVHTVLLIPQYIYRPWNIEADIEGTKVFYYPISNESLDPADSYRPNHILVLRYKALGDEVRLKIVKLLYEKGRTLQELTEHIQIGKSTIHHHLKILRSAKLVDIESSKYTLKRGPLESLPVELTHFLTKE
ncbi:DNA-binding MarR family transcriptional regulator [Bacillus pakistanensis]|uniref:DNA-binding MarR family transcriptional regulator n=1 Tax=Rossellomorea pakistanensis TaxID=992288 RepID=A0ABS2N7H4_9BACI|nr:winged helix-turn-helix domain-containing protein [Bacillus pakistanensis]MBM7583806.1 DNA-binding MarR family transcriptional regulator [Bacillus pakistanensis]